MSTAVCTVAGQPCMKGLLAIGVRHLVIESPP